ncbi:hypothetical protein BDQ17DRAFT_1330451 [Cyathus striatus]|nr:hypothetical protein BDQ17DRAFT_1330451 [Cyathus striatus]
MMEYSELNHSLHASQSIQTPHSTPNLSQGVEQSKVPDTDSVLYIWVTKTQNNDNSNPNTAKELKLKIIMNRNIIQKLVTIPMYEQILNRGTHLSLDPIQILILSRECLISEWIGDVDLGVERVSPVGETDMGSQRIQEIRTVFTNEGGGAIGWIKESKTQQDLRATSDHWWGRDGSGSEGGMLRVLQEAGASPCEVLVVVPGEVEGMVFLLVLRVLLEWYQWAAATTVVFGVLRWYSRWLAVLIACTRTDEEVMCGHVLGVLWLSAQRDRWLVMTAMSKPARAGDGTTVRVWASGVRLFMAHAASRDWGRLLEARRDMECSSLIMSALGSLEQTGGRGCWWDREDECSMETLRGGEGGQGFAGNVSIADDLEEGKWRGYLPCVVSTHGGWGREGGGE